MPMIDIAYVPTMCNHCDDAPCVAKGGGAVTKRDDGIVLIDPEKAKGRKDLVDACPYGHIWWNEEHQVPQALDVRRPPDRPGLAADARPPVVPDRRDARDQGRGRRDGAHGARGGARGDEARARHQAARLLPQPVALFEMLHRRLAVGGGRTASSTASRARRVRLCSRTATLVAEATSDNYGDFKFDKLDENSGRYVVEISAPGRPQEDGRGQARRQRQSRRDQAVAHSSLPRRLSPAHPRLPYSLRQRRGSPRDNARP